MDAADRPAERKALIAYMHWSRTTGERMLDWYSAHHLIKVAGRKATEHNDRADEAIRLGASSPAGVRRKLSKADELLDGLA